MHVSIIILLRVLKGYKIPTLCILGFSAVGLLNQPPILHLGGGVVILEEINLKFQNITDIENDWTPNVVFNLIFVVEEGVILAYL